MKRLNRWLERLSNWQYVAFTASLFIVVLAIGACFIRLATGHLNVSYQIGYIVVFTVFYTSISAWKRWK